MWETIRDEMTKQVEVKPLGDLKDHPDGPGCWCDPDTEVINEWWITTHHAADKREYFEKDTKERASVISYPLTREEKTLRSGDGEKERDEN